jgi:hypothetical protein
MTLSLLMDVRSSPFLYRKVMKRKKMYVLTKL